MNYRQSGLIALAVFAFFSLRFHQAPLQAYQIHYSWSGKLIPDKVEDPWLVGAQGKPFELEIVVSHDSADLLGLYVGDARHVIDHALLLLNGVEIPYMGDGFVKFEDDFDDAVDVMGFHGIFESLGHLVEISSYASLPISSFQFMRIAEPPPFFNSTVNSHTSYTSGRGPYNTSIVAGTPVVVVPEPATLALLCWAVLAFVATGLQYGRSIAEQTLPHPTICHRAD